MKRILIPADFTKLADYAYNMAHVLYKESDMEIHVFSVLDISPDILFDEKGELVDDGIFNLASLETLKKETEDTMQEWLKGKKSVAQSSVKLGRLSHDLVRYIKENEIDLVIMGTAGATGLKEVLSGSHTAYLAMRSPVPVLSVKKDRSHTEINNILLAGDFRNPQIVELSIVKDLARINEARIHLVKINTPGDFETNETIEARMKEFSELNELGDVDFHVYCDYNVEKGIDTFCSYKNMDIIAVGTQQRTALSRIVKRSLSYDVINHIKHPVISFPMN